MKDSEKFLVEINLIMQSKNVGMFEATLIFAEEHNIDVEDVAKALDPCAIGKIKDDALKENIVCNKKLFKSEDEVISIF